MQLSVFGVIFVKFSLIFATLFNGCNWRIITASGRKSCCVTKCSFFDLRRSYAADSAATAGEELKNNSPVPHLNPFFVEPFRGEISRKPSSPLPAVSYELLVVLVLCVMPFVRLRCARSAPLLLLLLLLFDCPPLMGDAIRLLIASVGSTEKLSPSPLSSSVFVGVVLELEERKLF